MPKRFPFGTIAKRKALAARVSAIASEALSVPVALTRRDPPFENELGWRLENFETERGPVAYLALDVCRRGVEIHSRFKFPQFAPLGANPYSGKWNHYIWTDDLDDIELEIRFRLSKLVPLAATRADRPSMLDYWAWARTHEAPQHA